MHRTELNDQVNMIGGTADLQQYPTLSLDDPTHVAMQLISNFGGNHWHAAFRAENDMIDEIGQCAGHYGPFIQRLYFAGVFHCQAPARYTHSVRATKSYDLADSYLPGAQRPALFPRRGNGVEPVVLTTGNGSRHFRVL
jgi:hypothetical protein